MIYFNSSSHIRICDRIFAPVLHFRKFSLYDFVQGCLDVAVKICIQHQQFHQHRHSLDDKQILLKSGSGNNLLNSLPQPG